MPWLLGATRVPIAIHVEQGDKGQKANKTWVEAQVQRANQAFAPAGITFISRPSKKGEPFTTPGGKGIESVAQRHALATHAKPRGTIHLFVVQRLANKDRSGSWISGVHWCQAVEDSAAEFVAVVFTVEVQLHPGRCPGWRWLWKGGRKAQMCEDLGHNRRLGDRR